VVVPTPPRGLVVPTAPARGLLAVAGLAVKLYEMASIGVELPDPWPEFVAWLATGAPATAHEVARNRAKALIVMKDMTISFAWSRPVARSTV
jgi:hypothetical protein